MDSQRNMFHHNGMNPTTTAKYTVLEVITSETGNINNGSAILGTRIINIKPCAESYVNEYPPYNAILVGFLSMILALVFLSIVVYYLAKRHYKWINGFVPENVEKVATTTSTTVINENGVSKISSYQESRVNNQEFLPLKESSNGIMTNGVNGVGHHGENF
ncbi:unnamed protein product [Didymodactylos carnosus]|uniref:Uncharacterized protein n=1 Tax=Didymodactylos carnosus TaxID=1234261 RepID=A0A815E2D2_9BILA|nr:unnamed protein product [Didymodactylos carnosus]CAF1309049.1 unnamed protein product [Didymodactylos carnosus]CAF4023170.1 unnamed protein product [Didymodactylos carnosus]CAF4145041.1 unnamed protein product [Didymodactylos carnosus]